MRLSESGCYVMGGLVGFRPLVTTVPAALTTRTVLNRPFSPCNELVLRTVTVCSCYGTKSARATSHCVWFGPSRLETGIAVGYRLTWICHSYGQELLSSISSLRLSTTVSKMQNWARTAKSRMRSDLNPARVTVARSLMSLTQAELAERSGVGQAHLSQIEHGLRGLTDEAVHRIAGSLGLPLEFFQVTDDTTTAADLTFRKLAGARVKATNQLTIRYSELKRVATLLLAAGNWRKTDLPVASGYMSSTDVEELADEVRRRMGFESPDDPIKHLTRAAERLGVAVAPLVDADEAEKWSGHDGVTGDWTSSGRAVIGCIPSRSGDRVRFNIGHELGHLVLHVRRTHLSDKDRESEAMRFAGAILLPRTAAEKHISETLNVNGYVKLKARYGISIQASIRRGYDLGLISQTRYRSLNVQISSKGWKRVEPVTVGMEKPVLLWRMMTRLYAENPHAAAVRDLAMSELMLRMWIPEVEGGGSGPRRGRSQLAPVTQLFRQAS